MNKSAKMQKLDYIWIGFLLIALVGITAVTSKSQPYLIAIMPIAFIMVVLLLSKGEFSFFLSILLLPLLSSVWLSFQLIPVSGAKINNLLLFVILIGILLNKKLKFKDIKLGALFYFGSLILFLFAVLRSGHTQPHFVYYWNEEYSPSKFFLSHGLIPIFTTIPTLVIIGTVRDKKRLYVITKYLAYSISLFSILIFVLFFLKVPRGADFSVVREVIGIENLGMHGNNLADFFIVTYPLMFIFSLLPGKDRKIYIITTILSILAVLITYSRTAYMMLLLSSLVIGLITRRYKLILGIVTIVVFIAIFVPSVANRAVSEIDSGHAGAISAGRTNLIWEEIIKDLKFESKTQPMKIVFGHGRYGVLSLDAFNNRRMLPVTHSHNMYLDTLVDTGIVGLAFYMIIFSIVLLKLFYRGILYIRAEDDEGAALSIGLLLGLIAFMGRGLSDSFFLPQLTNSYTYIFMALAFASFKMKNFRGIENE